MNSKQIAYIKKEKTKKRKLDCSNKRSYVDEVSVLASGLSQPQLGFKYPLYYYKCDFCKRYHLTRTKSQNSILCQ